MSELWSNELSGFWSSFIISITLLFIAANLVLLIGNRKKDNRGTTGHTYDGIEEYDTPLPRWWFWMFILLVVYGIGYFLYYPGLGNFAGFGQWTSIKQWQKEVDKAEKKYAPLFAELAAQPIEELIKNPKAMKTGQRLFANNCTVCHGSSATGSHGFPDLTDSDWLYGGNPNDIKHSISYGRQGVMPPWGEVLQPEQISQITQYVFSLSQRKTDPSKAQLGEPLYAQFCAACHGMDGSGNKALGAADLTDKVWLYGSSQSFVENTISKGRTGIMPAHKDLLSEQKVHVLTAYVYSLSQ